jgi:hypothetical protein
MVYRTPYGGDPTEGYGIRIEPKWVVYYRILAGPKVAVYSIEKDDEALLKALTVWNIREFSPVSAAMAEFSRSVRKLEDLADGL